VTGVLTGPPTTPPSAAAVVACDAPDQSLCHRAADDPAEDQADRRRGHRQPHHTENIVLLGETLGIGRAGAVAAHQGDRARHQPEHGVQAQETRHRHAQRILRQQERKQGEQEAQQARPAPPKHGEVGSQTD
jgi:hypothetical protein